MGFCNEITTHHLVHLASQICYVIYEASPLGNLHSEDDRKDTLGKYHYGVAVNEGLSPETRVCCTIQTWLGHLEALHLIRC
jgi:hypothetical protein